MRPPRIMVLKDQGEEDTTHAQFLLMFFLLEVQKEKGGKRGLEHDH